MAYEMVMPYHLHMPSYFLETFTEYPYIKGYDRYEKSPSNCMFNGLLFHFGLKTVGLPRFELGQTEPKPVVLPLHHSPIIMCFP